MPEALTASPEERIRAALVIALEEMGAADVEPRLERPRDPAHGDLATNVALALASRLRRPPREIAESLAASMDRVAAGVSSVEVAGPGFLNFRLDSDALARSLRRIVEADERWGRSDTGERERIIVEWVSANPTGPLHLGHGRQAALGDALCALLEWTGWSVHREFYYNDTGRQMRLLAGSLLARYRQRLGEPDEVPAGGYHGQYVVELADGLIRERGEQFLRDESEESQEELRRFAASGLMSEIRRDLDDFRVRLDGFYRESSLYEDGKVEDTIGALRRTGLVFERDGATWLRTTEFGDQKDRVMVRSDGTPTYFLPDIAYHVTKWERGFRRAINVQGADHHGTVARVRAGLRALGLPEGYPEYVLHQMVTVERGGEEVKFSKRAGSYTTLRELFEEVGVDVVRYFFQMRRPEAHLVFDLDVALDQSEKNPVYKIQYAHARMHSIFSKTGVDPGEIVSEGVNLELLRHPSERDLVTQLQEFPAVVERAAASRAPHLLCDYLEQTAARVNSWYHAGNPSRNPELAVLVPYPDLRRARLLLARAVMIVLRNGLALLGISAPERMERASEPGAVGV